MEKRLYDLDAFINDLEKQGIEVEGLICRYNNEFGHFTLYFVDSYYKYLEVE